MSKSRAPTGVSATLKMIKIMIMAMMMMMMMMMITPMTLKLIVTFGEERGTERSSWMRAKATR